MNLTLAPSTFGASAGSKTIVFDLLKRGNCVYTEIVPNVPKATLQAIIWGKPPPTALSIPTAGETMMGWLSSAWKSAFGLITTTEASQRHKARQWY